MVRRAATPLALFLIAGTFICVIRPLSADDEQGGPVVLMGIDAEDHWREGPAGADRGQHGPIANYVSVVSSILSNLSRGKSGLLVIGGGKDPADDVTTFWVEIARRLDQPLTFVNTAAAIRSVSLNGFAVLVIVSDATNTPSGGLTDAENDALTERQLDVAKFVNNGGGLIGFSSDFEFGDPYGYVGGIGGFKLFPNLEPGYSDILPVGAGPSLGITDALDVCCWHDVFLEFPSFLDVLARDADLTGLPAALGGAAVFVVPVANTVSGYMKLGGGRIANTGVEHWFHLACDIPARSTLERLRVRWGNTEFHLERMLTATCTEDPSNTKPRGKGAFDTHIGSGTGRLNRAPGEYSASWTFFDRGKKSDFASIVIRDASGNVVLNVSGVLSRGDQQAFGKDK